MKFAVCVAQIPLYKTKYSDKSFTIMELQVGPLQLRRKWIFLKHCFFIGAPGRVIVDS